MPICPYGLDRMIIRGPIQSTRNLGGVITILTVLYLCVQYPHAHMRIYDHSGARIQEIQNLGGMLTILTILYLLYGLYAHLLQIVWRSHTRLNPALRPELPIWPYEHMPYAHMRILSGYYDRIIILSWGRGGREEGTAKAAARSS